MLGKPPKDPAVTAVLATAGEVTIKPDFIIAKEAGFDFSLGQPEGAKRGAPKVLTTLFLFADGADKHRGYRDLPRGFAFTTRDELRDSGDSWDVSPSLRLGCTFEDGKLVKVYFGQPKNY